MKVAKDKAVKVVKAKRVKALLLEIMLSMITVAGAMSPKR